MSVKISFLSLEEGKYYKAYKLMVGSKGLRCKVQEKFMNYEDGEKASADGGAVIFCEKAYFHKGPFKLTGNGKVDYSKPQG